jgi:hypothetical protein
MNSSSEEEGEEKNMLGLFDILINFGYITRYAI